MANRSASNRWFSSPSYIPPSHLGLYNKKVTSFHHLQCSSVDYKLKVKKQEASKPVSEQDGQRTVVNEGVEILRGVEGVERVQSYFDNVGATEFSRMNIDLHIFDGFAHDGSAD